MVFAPSVWWKKSDNKHGKSNYDPVIKEKKKEARHWWFTPAILATWEAETGRISV
jgi:hypothetical protein